MFGIFYFSIFSRVLTLLGFSHYCMLIFGTIGEVENDNLQLLQNRPLTHCFHLKDDVHSSTHVRTLFTFWTAIFVKYDILTQSNWISNTFLVAMLVNEYKLHVSIQKSSKDAKFGQCLYLGVPLLWAELMRRTEWTSSLIYSERLCLSLYIHGKKCFFSGLHHLESIPNEASGLNIEIAQVMFLLSWYYPLKQLYSA
jgi:hypothetical protein